jgi:hypothetical protein
MRMLRRMAGTSLPLLALAGMLFLVPGLSGGQAPPPGTSLAPRQAACNQAPPHPQSPPSPRSSPPSSSRAAASHASPRQAQLQPHRADPAGPCALGILPGRSVREMGCQHRRRDEAIPAVPWHHAYRKDQRVQPSAARSRLRRGRRGSAAAGGAGQRLGRRQGQQQGQQRKSLVRGALAPNPFLPFPPCAVPPRVDRLWCVC